MFKTGLYKQRSLNRKILTTKQQETTKTLFLPQSLKHVFFKEKMQDLSKCLNHLFSLHVKFHLVAFLCIKGLLFGVFVFRDVMINIFGTEVSHVVFCLPTTDI